MPSNLNARWLVVLIALRLLVRSNLVAAVLTNVTVDDQLGDPVTGQLPTYLPAGAWGQGDGCSGCGAQPDASQAYDNTWHDTTYHPPDFNPPDPISGPRTVNISFTGTAVYAYCILVNTLPTNVTVFTNLTFSIDGESVGSYEHIPQNSSIQYIYHYPVYVNETLPDAPHTFIMEASGPNASLILFDYMTYTSNSSMPSSSSPPTPQTSAASPSHHNVGAIAGGTIGGVAFVGLVGLGIFLCLRRKDTGYRVEESRGKYPIITPFMGEQTHPSSAPSSQSTRNGSALGGPLSRFYGGAEKNPTEPRSFLTLDPSSSHDPSRSESSAPALTVDPELGPKRGIGAGSRTRAEKIRFTGPGPANASSAASDSAAGLHAGTRSDAAAHQEELSRTVREMEETVADLQSQSGNSSRPSPQDASGDRVQALQREIERLQTQQSQILWERHVPDMPPPQYREGEGDVP